MMSPMEISFRCFLSCKDTNSKANHNILQSFVVGDLDVSYLAKILILKQITTRLARMQQKDSMFPILQRY